LVASALVAEASPTSAELCSCFYQQKNLLSFLPNRQLQFGIHLLSSADVEAAGLPYSVGYIAGFLLCERGQIR